MIHGAVFTESKKRMKKTAGTDRDFVIFMHFYEYYA